MATLSYFREMTVPTSEFPIQNQMQPNPSNAVWYDIV